MKNLIRAMFGILILISATSVPLSAQNTLSKVDLVKAVFSAALTSETDAFALSGDLNSIQIDSTIIMWSESFGFGKIWLKGDPVGFTFRFSGDHWVFPVNNEVQQKLEALDEAYVIQIIKKLKKKK